MRITERYLGYAEPQGGVVVRWFDDRETPQSAMLVHDERSRALPPVPEYMSATRWRLIRLMTRRQPVRFVYWAPFEPAGYRRTGRACPAVSGPSRSSSGTSNPPPGEP